MSLLSEFKAFALKGNVVDLAVGVIIGGAFGKIISSLVSDVIMPPFGLLFSKVKFVDLTFVLSRKTDGTPLVTIRYGVFIQNSVEFLIIAVTIFIFIKFINRFLRQKPIPPAIPPKEEQLLSEIRDLLKERTKN